MVERCEETRSAPSRGELVETKLHRIARKMAREGTCEEPCALIVPARFWEGRLTTDVWSRYSGTAGKPGGNRENKLRPVALEGSRLLDKKFVSLASSPATRAIFRTESCRRGRQRYGSDQFLHTL